MLVASKIRIISTPQGEPPEWVRNAWIGCELSCILDTCGHVPVPVVGVDTRTFRGTVAGFSVDQGVALEALNQRNLEAAAWFGERGYPRAGEQFRFKAECCKVLEHTSLRAPKIAVWDDLEGPRND